MVPGAVLTERLLLPMELPLPILLKLAPRLSRAAATGATWLEKDEEEDLRPALVVRVTETGRTEL